MPVTRALFLAAAVFSLIASAQDPGSKSKAKPKSTVKAPAFTMPSLGEVPKAEGLHQKKSEPEVGLAKRANDDPKYEVVSVVHAAGFTGGPNGPQPVGDPMEAVDLRGKPLSTEKFSTVLTVRSAQKMGAPIDIAILDTRGDTVMSATGELSFFEVKGEEARYQIDWDKSPVRGPGEYKVLVRIAGTPMGTWPLKVRMDPAKAR